MHAMLADLFPARVVRVAPNCPTSATRRPTSCHVKARLFLNPYSKTHGLDR